MKCFSNPGYFVPLPPLHPFPVEKYPEILTWLKQSPAADRLHFELAPKASLEQVCTVHSSDYIASIANNTLGKYARNRLGLPIHPRWLERSLLDVGGTIAAARAALEDGVAWNLGGGTHHAMPAEGLGFCVLNDVAVAAKIILREQPDLRILVLDTDAHQGNGTHRILRECPGVFTFSIHVGANYPAVKEPGDLDVGLPRYVSGREYLKSLEAALTDVTRRFTPDLVFWVSGVDVLEQDRFGQMCLSPEDMARRDQLVMQSVAQWESALVGTLGGGYPLQRGLLASWHGECVIRTLEIT